MAEQNNKNTIVLGKLDQITKMDLEFNLHLVSGFKKTTKFKYPEILVSFGCDDKSPV